MSREQGKGPFSLAKPLSDDATPRVTILDATGAPFAYVLEEDCHGGDPQAAKARARRIAESLNKTEGFGS